MNAVTNEPMKPDGKFRKVGGTGLEVALSHNGKQVCIRRPSDPQQTVITSASAWQEFVNGIRAGAFDPHSDGGRQRRR
jgi:hypothetical protein